jgi:phenylacetate-CoA ligase
MGRADQTTKVKGMFVHPHEIAEIVRRHPEILRARLVVSHDAATSDVMTLHAEVRAGVDPGLATGIAETLHAVTNLRGTVMLAAPGSLPNDGKVIEDTRKVG